VSNLRLGFALICVAGCVDAIGFLHLRGIFVSFMSGNSTRAAIDAIHGDFSLSLATLGIVALFVAGAFIGECIALRSPRRGRRIVLACVGALLTASAFTRGPGIVPAIPIVLAMGIQNAALRKMGTANASLTYVTGSLVRLGEELAKLAAGKRTVWHIHATMWACMFVGASAGTLLFSYFHASAFLVAAACVGMLIIFSNPGYSSA
jgi:uncharacterized membrane protein YoaK (UPF0700 family)